MEFVSVDAIVNRVMPIENYIREFGTPDKVIDNMKMSLRLSWISGFVRKCDVQFIDDKASITLEACIDADVHDNLYLDKVKLWDVVSYPSELNDFRLVDMAITFHPCIDREDDD